MMEAGIEKKKVKILNFDEEQKEKKRYVSD